MVMSLVRDPYMYLHTRKVHIFEGELQKKGHIFSNWKRRHFTLLHKNLTYRDGQGGTVKGEYNLDLESTRIERMDDVGHEGLPGFSIYGRKANGKMETLLCAAADVNDMQHWLDALNAALHNGFSIIDQRDLWKTPFYPDCELHISYGGKEEVHDGTTMTPSSLINKPRIMHTAECEGHHYSLFLVDLGDPMRKGDHVIHYAVVNIPNIHLKIAYHNGIRPDNAPPVESNNIGDGSEVLAYLGPAPEYNSGKHRYYFYIFEQKSEITSAQLAREEAFATRIVADFPALALRLGFGDPIGVDCVRAEWEEGFCDEVHAQRGYMPEERFRSPSQKRAVAVHELQAEIDKHRRELCESLHISDALSHASLGLHMAFWGEGGQDHGVRIDSSDFPPQFTIAQMKTAPSLDIESSSASLHGRVFMLVMSDLDFPERITPSNPSPESELCILMVANIQLAAGAEGEGQTMNYSVSPSSESNSTGHVLCPYERPRPFHSSGVHRYVLRLYEQPSVLTHEQLEGIRLSDAVTSRTLPPPATLVGFLGLYENAVAIQAFTSHWDETCDEIHAALGITPSPDRFLSPGQRAAIQAELDRQAEEARLEMERIMAAEAEAVARLKKAEEDAKRKIEEAKIKAEKMKAGLEKDKQKLRRLSTMALDRETAEELRIREEQEAAAAAKAQEEAAKEQQEMERLQAEAAAAHAAFLNAQERDKHEAEARALVEERRRKRDEEEAATVAAAASILAQTQAAAASRPPPPPPSSSSSAAASSYDHLAIDAKRPPKVDYSSALASFRITTDFIFTGYTMSVKYNKSTAFASKFVWIDPDAATLNWAENEAAKYQDKFESLKISSTISANITDASSSSLLKIAIVLAEGGVMELHVTPKQGIAEAEEWLVCMSSLREESALTGK